MSARRALPWLLLAGWLGLSLNACAQDTPAVAEVSAADQAEAERLEKSLQNLSWEQFRFVAESVPKLKHDIDAYGSLGWDYVKANYSRRAWRKNILRMDAAQRKQLEQLIRKAQKPAPTNKKAAR